jgi:hypothetical protein
LHPTFDILAVTKSRNPANISAPDHDTRPSHPPPGRPRIAPAIGSATRTPQPTVPSVMPNLAPILLRELLILTTPAAGRPMKAPAVDPNMIAQTTVLAEASRASEQNARIPENKAVAARTWVAPIMSANADGRIRPTVDAPFKITRTFEDNFADAEVLSMVKRPI